jgi:hypothetical protein
VHFICPEIALNSRAASRFLGINPKPLRFLRELLGLKPRKVAAVVLCLKIPVTAFAIPVAAMICGWAPPGSASSIIFSGNERAR